MFRIKQIIFSLAFLICYALCSHAQFGHIDSLIITTKSLEPGMKKIENYGQIASFYINILNDDKSFDSISQLAISTAEAGFDKEVILKANLNYLENMPKRSNSQLVGQIINRSESLIFEKDEQFQFDTWLLFSASYRKVFDKTNAHRYALKALSSNQAKKNIINHINAQLEVGMVLEIENQYVEAFQHYMNSLYQAETITDEKKKNDIKSICHNVLFNFHLILKNYDEAARFKNLVIENTLSSENIDSTFLFFQYYDMAGLNISSGRFTNLSQRLDKILSFAKRAQNDKLRDYTLSLYRSLMIESKNFYGFYDLYHNRYPQELSKIRNHNPSLYYRIMAYGHQSEQQYDSMEHYMTIAEEYVLTNKNEIAQSNFYKRYGELLLSNNNTDKAYLMYIKAYNLAKEKYYIPFLLESSLVLDSLAMLQKDYRHAYLFKSSYDDCIKEQEKRNNQDKLLLIELENQQMQIELKKEQEAEDQRKKFNLQYLILTVVITSFFILMIIVSSIAIPEWVIRTLGFMGILMLFEFIILILDQKIHHMTHGAPMPIFIIKMAIVTVLFPLHHIIEKRIIQYLIDKKQLWRPTKSSISNIVYLLWPWLDRKK